MDNVDKLNKQIAVHEEILRNLRADQIHEHLQILVHLQILKKSLETCIKLNSFIPVAEQLHHTFYAQRDDGWHYENWSDAISDKGTPLTNSVKGKLLKEVEDLSNAIDDLSRSTTPIDIQDFANLAKDFVGY
jgi:hypothetical protein